MGLLHMKKWAMVPDTHTTTPKGAVGSGATLVHCRTARGGGHLGSFSAPLHQTGQRAAGSLH